MKILTRVERLESALASGGAEVQYDNHADFLGHESYVTLKDGSCMDIPGFKFWPDETSLWASRPDGTMFLRIGGEETAEVIDGRARPVHFRQIEMTPEAQLRIEEMLRTLGVDPPQGVAP